eukprot:TRINITY_DN5851_c0_g1_i1.p1 TRINITY_DN5851_c0_g1~~TRINITY_DN5851_c0_g1_i1.p1  ORF type:complete len:247 (-),score=23.72 TRINITY_DN5851_c0_g1_i1:317-1057(-)
MGCASSASSSPVHAICKKAFQHQSTIDEVALRSAMQGMDASRLNEKESPYGWTVLDYLALNRSSTGVDVAADIVLDGGADPFSGARTLGSTALGRCVKYRNLVVLNKCLERLDEWGWDKFTNMLTASIQCTTGSAVDEGVWVQVGEKRGKTGLHVEMNPVFTDRNGVPMQVFFEDGTRDTVQTDKIVILPQAHSSVLELIHNKIVDSHVQLDIDVLLERLKTCEETDRTIDGLFTCPFLFVLSGVG